jgi:CHAD domain-containing protein
MNCLERYRSNLIRKTNQNLRALLAAPEETAVHDFRVGIKRLGALYRFVGGIDDSLKAGKAMKPCRALFKRAGAIRDTHIALQLLAELDDFDARASRSLVNALRARLRNSYRELKTYARSYGATSIRLPTIRSTGLGDAAILRHKPLALQQLLSEITDFDGDMSEEEWHRKRILLKRYHHLVDAFAGCPGHSADEKIMKRVVILEQLLGDWHDRVISAEILSSLPGPEANREKSIAAMRRQGEALLGSSRLYLRKLATRREYD